jgi:hypothetical protein
MPELVFLERKRIRASAFNPIEQKRRPFAEMKDTITETLANDVAFIY